MEHLLKLKMASVYPVIKFTLHLFFFLAFSRISFISQKCVCRQDFYHIGFLFWVPLLVYTDLFFFFFSITWCLITTPYCKVDNVIGRNLLVCMWPHVYQTNWSDKTGTKATMSILIFRNFTMSTLFWRPFNLIAVKKKSN